MELRLLILCNEHGQKTEPTLQFRDGVFESWQDVPVVEMKTWECEKEQEETGS